MLICSELFEARRVADLLGRANVVLSPAWNTDTASYDLLIQSVGFELRSIIAIAKQRPLLGLPRVGTLAGSAR